MLITVNLQVKTKLKTITGPCLLLAEGIMFHLSAESSIQLKGTCNYKVVNLYFHTR